MKTQLKSYTPELKLSYSKLALGLEFKGCVTRSTSVWHWDISPIEGRDGTIHLFLGEWEGDFSNWYKNARLAHYIADSPEGPFIFQEYTFTPDNLPGDYTSIYNARVKRIDDIYVMVYSAARYNGDDSYTLENQATCIAYSHSLEGPWNFYGQDGTLIKKSNAFQNFSYKSCCGCVNACIEKIGNQYYVFFRAGKSRSGEMKYGYLTSDKLLSDYVLHDEALTDNINYIEDADCLFYNGNEYLLTTDNTGGNSMGFSGDINGRRTAPVGLLWQMKNGRFSLKNAQIGFGLLSDYVEDMSQASCPPFGAYDKMERPAFLIQNGIPTYLYTCAYTSIEGTQKSQTYVFKINEF